MGEQLTATTNPPPDGTVTLEYVRTIDKPASLFTYRAGLFCFMSACLIFIGLLVAQIPAIRFLLDDWFKFPLMASPFLWVGGLVFGIVYAVKSIKDPGYPQPSDQRRAWLVFWGMTSAMVFVACIFVVAASFAAG